MSIINLEHLSSRLKVLAAWHDPDVKERPRFPFGAHNWLRQAACVIDASQKGLRTIPQLTQERIGSIAAKYRLPEQTVPFAKEVELEALRAAHAGELLTREKLADIVTTALRAPE